MRGLHPVPAWQAETQLRGLQPVPAWQAETQLRDVQAEAKHPRKVRRARVRVLCAQRFGSVPCVQLQGFGFVPCDSDFGIEAPLVEQGWEMTEPTDVESTHSNSQLDRVLLFAPLKNSQFFINNSPEPRG